MVVTSRSEQVISVCRHHEKGGARAGGCGGCKKRPISKKGGGEGCCLRADHRLRQVCECCDRYRADSVLQQEFNYQPYLRWASRMNRSTSEAAMLLTNSLARGNSGIRKPQNLAHMLNAGIRIVRRSIAPPATFALSCIVSLIGLGGRA